MLLSRIEVISGPHAGVAFEPGQSIVTVGRSDDNDLSLPQASINDHHLSFRIGVDKVFLETALCGSHTAVARAGAALVLPDGPQRQLLQADDVVELGTKPGEPSVRLALRFAAEEAFEPQVVAMRPAGRWEPPGSLSRVADAMAALNEAERSILSASGLGQVYTAVLDAALRVIPRATHATLILRDEPLDGPRTADSAYVQAMTRARLGEDRFGAATVPVVRSIFRKVIDERSSVLAADATSDGLGSESLLGSNIRSTVAVPLWKDEAVVGVLQLDNRSRPAMFDKADLDLVSIVATTASLAVSNAHLIERLSALEQQQRQENAFWRQRERQRGAGGDLIGESAAMRQLCQQIDRVANTRATVLIEGETGVGKELAASSVHARSGRRDRLFVAQNCATLPENLLESELFGHKKGSFTGAIEDKKGLFEVADGGTLFLDEIAEIPLVLQAKLLRALQEGEVRPVGSSRPKHVDVRIIAASNRDLEREVREGRFREDLFYRLNVFPLRVPPLRERRDDVPLLARHFLQRYTRDFGKPVAGITDPALQRLAAYAWPGNVRELQNEVQRLVIQAEVNGWIDIGLLSDKFNRSTEAVPTPEPEPGTLKEMLEQVERKLVEQALLRHGNNKTSTAKALGITREGLHKKLRQLKL